VGDEVVGAEQQRLSDRTGQRGDLGEASAGGVPADDADLVGPGRGQRGGQFRGESGGRGGVEGAGTGAAEDGDRHRATRAEPGAGAMLLDTIAVSSGPVLASASAAASATTRQYRRAKVGRKDFTNWR
jgi:hypothetical protein